MDIQVNSSSRKTLKLYVKKNKLLFFSTILNPLFQHIPMANKDKFLTPFLFTIIPSNLIQLLKNEIYTGEMPYKRSKA